MSLLWHWLHLIAAVAWIGGVTFLVGIFLPISPAMDPVARAQLLPRLMRRFLFVVWTAVALLLTTGLYRLLAVQHMGTTQLWFHTGYGHTLMTKLVCYLLLVGIVTHLTLLSYPRTRDHMREHLTAPAPTACTTCARLARKTRRILWIAWSLGVLVLLLAARLRGA